MAGAAIDRRNRTTRLRATCAVDCGSFPPLCRGV